MTEQDVVLYQARDGVARITINRPDRRNSINPEVVSGLLDCFARAEDDNSIRVAVLTGAGEKAFSAGGDLGGMVPDSKVAQHWQRAEVGELFDRMRKSHLPIVARVNGHALAGGFGLMLACDLVVAAERAQMGTPEVNIGLWPFMITAVIQRDLPRKVAMELMLTGRRMDADEGRRWGFVNEVTAAEDLDEAVDRWVGDLLDKSPLILGLGKRSFYRASDMDFSEGLDYLAGMLTVCLESEDTVEGVTAFLEKRKPEWKGR